MTEFALSYNSFHICVETKFGTLAWRWTNTFSVETGNCCYSNSSNALLLMMKLLHDSCTIAILLNPLFSDGPICCTCKLSSCICLPSWGFSHMLHNFILLRAQIAVVIVSGNLISSKFRLTNLTQCCLISVWHLNPKCDQTSTFNAAGTDVKML